MLPVILGGDVADLGLVPHQLHDRPALEFCLCCFAFHASLSKIGFGNPARRPNTTFPLRFALRSPRCASASATRTTDKTFPERAGQSTVDSGSERRARKAAPAFCAARAPGIQCAAGALPLPLAVLKSP